MGCMSENLYILEFEIFIGAVGTCVPECGEKN